MNLRVAWAIGFAVLLAGCRPATQPTASRTIPEQAPEANTQAARRATRAMASWIDDLQRQSVVESPGASRTVGNLWIDSDRLKRSGHDVRNLEWRISELEESLRRNPPDPASRRHILNNLHYEIEALNRPNR